jgi:hypothetical protein
MKETGVVTDIKGEMAVVKVIRLITTGGGCCGTITTRKPFFLETRNLCQASIGDQVKVESDYDKARVRKLVQIGICLAAFTIGIGIGDSALGISAYKAPAAFGLGILLAIIAFGIIRWFNKKNPSAVPVAYETASV